MKNMRTQHIANALDSLGRNDFCDYYQDGTDIIVFDYVPASALKLVSIASAYGMRVDFLKPDDPMSPYRLSF